MIGFVISSHGGAPLPPCPHCLTLSLRLLLLKGADFIAFQAPFSLSLFLPLFSSSPSSSRHIAKKWLSLFFWLLSLFSHYRFFFSTVSYFLSLLYTISLSRFQAASYPRPLSCYTENIILECSVSICVQVVLLLHINLPQRLSFLIVNNLSLYSP